MTKPHRHAELTAEEQDTEAAQLEQILAEREHRRLGVRGGSADEADAEPSEAVGEASAAGEAARRPLPPR